MNCIDSHLHLDAWQYPDIANAAKVLNSQLVEANVDKGVVLHLQIQPWSVAEVSKVIQQYPRIEAFVNVHPDDADALQVLEYALKHQHFCGIKLHPRLQKFSLDHPNLANICQLAAELSVPILLDAFPDGTAMMQGFSPLDYAALAKRQPNTRFIWAHMGGHYVLDMMMLAKRLANVYFDCSYSLLYFRGSSVPQNMIYAMQSMRFERIFYGSDYPDRDIASSLNQSLAVFAQFGLTDPQLEKVLYLNFKEFMAW